jgi:hypothetical protein
MTFRPGVRDRYAFLMVLAICVGLFAYCGYRVAAGGTGPKGSFTQPLAITGVLLVLSAYFTWTAFRGAIRMTDAGLEWKDMTDQGSVAWEDVRGIGYKQYPGFVKPGLVLRSTPELKFLPFFTPALYSALRERCGRLPAEIEKSLGFRS